MVINYKELYIYKLSYELTLKIYKIIEKFPESENKNMSLQLRRAMVSIPLNIAEGTSRKSKKEFLNFLIYAFGSAKEVEVLLSLANDIGYINVKEYNLLNKDVDKMLSKIFLFIRHLESTIKGNRFTFFQQLDRDNLISDVGKKKTYNKK